MESRYITYQCKNCGRFYQKKKYSKVLFLLSFFRLLFGTYCPKCGSGNTQRLKTKDVLKKSNWH